MKQNTLLDLHMLRASSIFLAAGYALMGIAPTGLIFTFCSIISTFGQGFLPTIQSVAAILYISASGEGDTGRLFGALSVVYVVGWVSSLHNCQTFSNSRGRYLAVVS